MMDNGSSVTYSEKCRLSLQHFRMLTQIIHVFNASCLHSSRSNKNLFIFAWCDIELTGKLEAGEEVWLHSIGGSNTQDIVITCAHVLKLKFDSLIGCRRYSVQTFHTYKSELV
jgi:hypothetical protein